jgi:PAS domain S-box-containing protein
MSHKIWDAFIIGAAGGRRINTTALRVLVSLLWVVTAFGLCTSSLAQQAESAGTTPVMRSQGTPAVSGIKVSLTPQEQLWLSRHEGTIRIGITVIPPQVLRGNGQYKGLCIDYIRLIERRLGCGFKLVPYTTWNEVIQAAKARRIDMIFAAQQTPERQQYLLFTEPYIELPNMIVVRKDRKGGENLKDMLGWRVATSEGSAVHEYLKREFPDLDLHPVPDELNGLIKVSVGEADAMVVEISRASYYIERAGIVNLRVSGSAGLLYRLRFAVRNDWPVLRGILDKGLAGITDDERREIDRRWIIVGDKGVFASRGFWIACALALAAILLAAAGVVVWNRTLRRLVRQRTSQLRQELAEREKAEEALRQSEEKYRRIVDTASEGIWVLGPDTRTTFVNARMAEMLGYCGAEMIGRPISDFMFEEDVPGHLCRMEGWRKGVSESYEHRFRCKVGGMVWTQVSAMPIFDEARSFQGSFGMFTDVTGRKQAEEALLRLNRQLRAISTCNQILMQASDEQTLLAEICRIVCEEAGYRMAWVGYPLNDDARTIRPMAWAGAEEGYLAEAGVTWADTVRGRGPSGRAIREGASTCIQDFASDLQAVPWRESALLRGYRSSIALPLKEESGTPFGALCIYSVQPGTFKPEEIKLLEELAGNLAFGICVMRTRIARKQADQDVALMSFALDNVHEAAFLIDEHARFVYVNEESCRALGYTREELHARGVADVDPDFPPEHWADHWRELATKRTIIFEGRHKTRDGRILPVEINANYIEYGQKRYNLALVRDITERRLSEEKLKASEERLRLTMEAAQIGIWDWDVINDQYYASPIYYSMLGYRPKEGPADRNEWMQRLHPDDKQAVREKIQKVLSRTCDDYSYEARLRHADGSYKWQWSVGYGAQCDQNGKLTRMLGLRMDIDDRKRAEEELARYHEHLEELVQERTAELEAANKELDAFAYSVSHDLRAPLRHIDGFMELLQKKTGPALDEQSRHYMAAISGSAQKMTLLVDDLLSFSRMGRQAMSFKQVDLAIMVREVICELEPDAAGRDITWHVGELPTVSGDAAMLRMVLANLIANALKFTRPRPQARIEVGSLPGQASEAVIFVRDNGVGFDMTYADKLFGVFQRLHHADEFEGTGIGLANARRIIARHGGRTWAEGKVDQGATFNFALPLTAKMLL